MKKSKIAKFLLVLLKVMFISGIVCLLFIPMLYNLFAEIGVPRFKEQHFLYQVAFYVCYIVSLGVIFELIKVFDLVYSGSPFQKKLELNLKKIAIMFMLLSIIVGLKMYFIPTILSGVVVLVTFIVSLSFYVLSQVFKVAIEYKLEIDYTV